MNTNHEGPSAAGNPKTRLEKYFFGMFALLCVATYFEGYDFFLVSLIQSELIVEFHVRLESVLVAVGIINVGAILGFFLVRAADRFGRKPIFIIGVAGYAGLSLLTGFMPGVDIFASILRAFSGWLEALGIPWLSGLSPKLTYYTILQFITKIFLVTEFGLAIVIVTEESPPGVRATCIAAIEVLGAVGGCGAMLLSKSVLNAWHWQGMYLIGGLPLLIVPFLIFFLRETTHFKRAQVEDKVRTRKSLFNIWTTAHRKDLVIVAALWFLGYLSYAGIIYHWPIWAETERSLSVSDVGLPMAIAAAVGMSGYIVSGMLMDWIGRRKTSMIFFMCGAAALVWTYTAHGAFMAPSLMIAMFFIFAVIPICSTINAELFPTEVRADAFAWCNYVVGRSAQVLAPIVVASLKGVAGSLGNTLCLLALGPFLAAFVVFFFVRETKGIKLEEVH